MADYTDVGDPEALCTATRGTHNVYVKRLPDGAAILDDGADPSSAATPPGSLDHQIKVLKTFPLEEYKRVQRSINAAHRLKHPGIVPVECAFIDKSQSVVVVQLPYFKGGDLRRWVTTSAAGDGNGAVRSHGVLLATALRIAQAVEFLHLKRLLHRDIKPENIVMDASDDGALPALCDFDLCVAADQTMTTATTRRGTLLYMPPDARVSEASDVYALGITLLDILFCDGACARIPTTGGAMNPVDLAGVGRMLNAAAQQDPALVPLAALVGAMTVADPSKRPPMTAVVGELQKLVETDLVARNQRLEEEQAALAAQQARVAAADASVAARGSEISDRAARVAAEEGRIAREKRALDREKQRIAQTEFPVPGYWRHKDLRSTHFGLKVSNSVKAEMQRLLRGNNMQHSCGNGNMNSATVTKVERIENTVLWKNYHHKKSVMTELARGSAQPREVKPAGILGAKVLHRPLNEVMLFHGTSPATAKLIAKHGFDERVASLGGLYGAGCYFAENACKSSQYARDATSAGERTIMFCRVLMGDSHHTSSGMAKARRPPDIPGRSGRTYDSVLASGGSQVHREFMVYDKNQVYPEYIVYYR